MRVTEDSTNTLRHSVCKAAVGAEQTCTAEFFPGWDSGEQESWSRVGGLARGPDADTGSSLWMSRQGAGSPAHVVINSLPTKIGWERADGRRDLKN